LPAPLHRLRRQAETTDKNDRSKAVPISMPILPKLLKYLLPLLLRCTSVTRLVTATDRGPFAFLPQDRFIGWKMALQGTRDPELTCLVESLVGPGDLVIDAGANLGWYSVVLGQRVGPDGLVLAFEPEPHNFDLLRQNLVSNRVDAQVRATNAALSSHPGSVTLELSATNLGDHRVRLGPGRKGVRDQYGESQREVREVPATTLDAALEAAGVGAKPVRFIKIDCQGHEVEILRGAGATLRRTESLLLEYWPYGLRRCGASLDDLLACLGDHFVRFARIGDGGARARYRPFAEFRAEAGTVKGFTDYLFVRS
jgi:FkbM family methyltransferase